MTFSKLIHKNITHFARYYRLVAAAVLITVGVIAGSLVVGDSVRTTLVRRVAERLGDTETIIFSRNSFMSEELLHDPLFADAAKGYLLSNGFISRDGKLIPVSVWGTEDASLPRGSARINKALARELGANNAADIVLRLPAAGLIPAGSLFVTENYTTSLRLTFGGIIDADDGGNLSMKNEQIIPFNIFVNRAELAETMEMEGKINLILTAKEITPDALNNAWNYHISGLQLNPSDEFTEILSDRVFIQQDVAESIARNNGGEINRLFSYLANSMDANGRSVPYSFVTAMDSFEGEALQSDEIILPDYTARRLQVQAGDTVGVSYFTSADLKTLATQSIRLRVKKIVPLATLRQDSTLSADFPGLSDVERCTDWDSDLPIDMSLITDEDEKYWELYRSTPKAIIAYNAVAPHWSNAYGSVTALRLARSSPDLSSLHAEMFGIQLIHPREQGLYAAKNGVDFAGLFLALGFFIIVAAILLMLIPVSEMLWQRRNEITLLQSLGYTRSKIVGMLWKESAPVVLLASMAGVVAGLLYTALIMWLLGNVWKGATHTDGFAVYPSPGSMLAGLVVGIALALGVLRWQVARAIPSSPGLKATPSKGGHRAVSCPPSEEVPARGRRRISNKPSRPSLLSFGALTLGVFIVFFVGLNRRGFADSSQIRTGTGGYTLWCESSVPVYHNMATAGGREKLSLTGLPDDAVILQCLRYGADDASCLNLNKVSTPTVLGVDMEALPDSDFRIEESIVDFTAYTGGLKGSSEEVIPALIDATVLTWGLMMNLGDTLRYEDDRGKSVAILLAGTLSNSIFQGHILIDRRHFAQIWPETTGSEIFLLKVNEAETEGVKNLLGQALNEYGVRVTTTADRLRQFNTVTDTYLTIFLTLGGLGLLLGIMAFIIVVRKNLIMRHREIDLYRTLGFTDRRIAQILTRENLRVPLAAIATGLLCALLCAFVGLRNVGINVWLLAALFALLFVGCVVLFVRKCVANALRGENSSEGVAFRPGEEVR